MIFEILTLICCLFLGARVWPRFSAWTDKLFRRALSAPSNNFETKWSELNPDLLRLISKKFGGVSNFVRFRVVCKQWRSAVSSSDLPPQLPWFIKRTFSPLSNINFYSLYTDKTHTLHLPELEGKFIYGSENYLLLKDLSPQSKVVCPSILINPLNRHKLGDPYPNGLPIHIYAEDDRRHRSKSNPCENNIRAAVLTGHFFRRVPRNKYNFSYLESDDSSRWSKVEVCCGYDYPGTVYKGNLFIYCLKTLETKVVDIRTGNVVSVIPGKLDGLYYFIKAYDDLLGVVMENGNTKIGAEWRFKVYRLEQGGKTPVWAEMSQGIGDLILFVDDYGGFSLKASDFDGLVGNKIYFHKWINGKIYLCIYDLEKATTQLVRRPSLDSFRDGTWFVPSL